MSSLKQQILAKKVADAFNNGLDKTQGQLIKEAGYSEVSSYNPKIVLSSTGFKEELAKLGFSIDAADMTVKNLLINGKKEETKLKAADMVYKRLGGYAPDRTISLNLKGSIEQFQQGREIAEKYEAELIEKYASGTNEEVDSSVDRAEPNQD